MRVGERNIDGVELDRRAHLAPVGGDHVGRRQKTGRAAELRHHLAAGIAILGAAWILRIGKDSVLAAAQADGLGERPGAVRVEGDAGLRKTFR